MKLGSKIDNLQTMKDAGLPVPDFTAIPFSALVPDAAPLHAAMDEVRNMAPAEQSRRLRETVRALLNPELPAFEEYADLLRAIKDVL